MEDRLETLLRNQGMVGAHGCALILREKLPDVRKALTSLRRQGKAETCWPTGCNSPYPFWRLTTPTPTTPTVATL